MRELRRSLVVTVLVVLGGVALSTPANAVSSPKEVATNSNGVGVCMSQVAIQPELLGASRLGAVVSSAAEPGTPGSEVPELLDGVDGDVGLRNTCGGPPGPGHLQP